MKFNDDDEALILNDVVIKDSSYLSYEFRVQHL